MLFSVIVPTRNRPEQLRIALDSIAQQDFPDYEIIVIEDGSEPHHHAAYQQLRQEINAKQPLQWHTLEVSLHGHGPSFSRNLGALHAQGEFLCFLDDDDSWADSHHLHRAANVLQQSHADVYLSNQTAFREDKAVNDGLWLADLARQVNVTNRPLIEGTYPVSIDELMQINGFSHLNTTVVSRTLFMNIDGFDESLRYEEDRDFYYRLLDHANLIFYNPLHIARHNVPGTSNNNLSTQKNKIEQKLQQLSFLNKLLVTIQNPVIRKVIRTHKTYTLKALSQLNYQAGRHDLALHYAKEVLWIGFSVKWLIFTGFLFFRCSVKRFGNSG